ncbi:MAG TPA: DUF2127 domain-containing protein [Candidatus Binatia bacterium]|nr:DUF2127 domain-containing protein [Candidatus Binatia bacterium]
MHIHFNLDKVFVVSILLKSLDAIAELIGGVLLLAVSPHFIEHLTNVLTAHALSQNSDNFWAKSISHDGQELAHNSRLYGGLYLLIHGIVKIAVIIGVLKQKLWAYPALIVVIGGFMIFQIIEIVRRFSLGLTLLSAFDAFIVVLTYLEWQKHKRRLAAKPAN